MITLKLLTWLIPIAAFVVADWWQIVKKHSRPNYLLENILKGGVFILYGVYVFDTQNDLRTVAILLYCVTSYWLLFDISMGLILHGDPFYIGKNSGYIDRFAYKTKWTMVAYWALKILAIYVCAASITYIYNG